MKITNNAIHAYSQIFRPLFIVLVAKVICLILKYKVLASFSIDNNMIHGNFEATVLRCARGNGGVRCGGAVIGPLHLAGYGPHYNDHRKAEGRTDI